jgi:hypothetical protein
MTTVSFNEGASDVPEGGNAGSVNTGEEMQNQIQESANGPVPVRFYARNSGLALTQQEAEANPKNAIIPFGGSSSSLRDLMNGGLVARDAATGSYFDTRGKPPVAPSSAPAQSNALTIQRGGETQQGDAPEGSEEDGPERDDLEGFEMSPEGSEAVKAVQGIYAEHPDTVDHAVTMIATQGAAALSDEQMFRDINAATGQSEEEARSTMGTAMAEYTAAANHAIKDYPVGDPQEVWNWMWAERPALASKAVYGQLEGDFTAHHEAAREYLGTLDKYDPESCLAADLGPEAKAIRENGQIVVEWGGKKYLWRDALKLGGVI